MRIKTAEGVMAEADKRPHDECTIFMCLGDLELISVPLQLFGFQKESFAVVEGPKADKIDFCRQGLEPVVCFVATLAQAYVLTHKLPNHRWAVEVPK